MINRTLEETVNELSPEALRIYRQQLATGGAGMPEDIPFWQKPLEWLRTAEQAAGAFLGAPFSPAIPGTEGLPWWEREKAEHEAWQAP